MDDKLVIVSLIIAIICMIMSFILFLKISRMRETVAESPEILAKLMLIDKKLNILNSEMEKLAYQIQNIEPYKVKEVDEMTGYLESGMSVSQIAKEKNMSVKEVELILAMKGLM